MHAVLCSPITTFLIARKSIFSYLLTIITLGCRCICSKKKVALCGFKNLNFFVENGSDNKLKILFRDRGTSFYPRTSQCCAKRKTLEHQLTALYTPQQISIVERRNHTIMNTARSLLKSMLVQRFFGARQYDMQFIF